MSELERRQVIEQNQQQKQKTLVVLLDVLSFCR